MWVFRNVVYCFIVSHNPFLEWSFLVLFISVIGIIILTVYMHYKRLDQFHSFLVLSRCIFKTSHRQKKTPKKKNNNTISAFITEIVSHLVIDPTCTRGQDSPHFLFILKICIASFSYYFQFVYTLI